MISSTSFKITIFISISILLLGLVIGCGKSEDQSTQEDVIVNQSSDEVSIDTDEQKTNIATELNKSVEIPDGYPEESFPIYKGAFISAASENKDGSFSIIYFVNESQKTLTDYYKDVLKDANVSMETNDDGYMNLGDFEGYNYNLVIGEGDDSIGYKSMVTLIMTPSDILDGE